MEQELESLQLDLPASRIKRWVGRIPIAAIILISTIGIYNLWIPDVSYLSRENPKTTAYIQLYMRRAKFLGKKPVVMMRWLPIDQMSDHLCHAVVISEDDMFYKHHGVDWSALREAFRYNWKKGKMARGGSTITQQVARNLFLSPARSPLRKLREMLIAWRLERTLSKKRILEIYLNIAEWGAGIYGAQAASQIYFDKPAAELTPEEAVALASALPSPWRLNPSKEVTPRLEARRLVLLARMRRAGYLPVEIHDFELMPLEPIEIQIPERVTPADAAASISSTTSSSNLAFPLPRGLR